MELRTRRDGKEYQTQPEEAKALVEKFSREIIAELGTLVKSVVWFGSIVRKPFKDGKKELKSEVLFGSDIDVLLVIDDQIHILTAEVITAYRVVVEKTASKVSKRFHITTLPVTKFWNYASTGDPILINMLRDGTAVFDTGCFGMAKNLLNSERIKPTKEAVWSYLSKAPASIANAHWNMKQATLALYWSVIDAAHSALLHKDVAPESPEHILPLMRSVLVAEGLIDKKSLSIVGEFQNIGDMIMKNQIHKIRGDQYDRYRSEAIEFMNEVRECFRK